MKSDLPRQPESSAQLRHPLPVFHSGRLSLSSIDCIVTCLVSYIPALRIHVAHRIGLPSITAQWVTCDEVHLCQFQLVFIRISLGGHILPGPLNSECLHSLSNTRNPTPVG